MDLFCHVRNKVVYVLWWWTVSALTGVSEWCLFPLLLCNSGNKHQNNPLASTETVHHSGTYIILCKHPVQTNGLKGNNILYVSQFDMFHNYFSSSGEQPQQCILAYKSEQPTVDCIAIFHKCCCCIKYGGIIRNLTLWNLWGYVTYISIYHTKGAWIIIHYVLCSSR